MSSQWHIKEEEGTNKLISKKDVQRNSICQILARSFAVHAH